MDVRAAVFPAEVQGAAADLRPAQRGRRLSFGFINAA